MIPEDFKRRNTIPDVEGIPQVLFKLDGGGREMITDILHAQDITCMVEVGVYLGGSASVWLDAKDDLELIGIDPWLGEWHVALERYKNNPKLNSCWQFIEDRDAAIQDLKSNRNFDVAMANLQRFRGRFFPVVGKSPDMLHKLDEDGVRPQLLYFDSNKVLDDLETSLTIFPDAVLCGDDWTWGADKGLPVQKAVKAFCQKHGFEVEDRRATWLIHR